MHQHAHSTSHISPCQLRQLQLFNFRNYQHAKINITHPHIVITGPNGSGKTNILEAVSFLSPGKGLRNITLDEADRREEEKEACPWTIAATLYSKGEERQVGTGRDSNIPQNKRLIKIDGNPAKNQSELADICSVMWLTPQMQGLFIEGATARRKFLDRLVYTFSSEHAERVYSYEYAMRERARLLQERGDPQWILILETKMAEKAVAIAAARNEAIDILQETILQSDTPFPKALIRVEGAVESWIREEKALGVEERIKTALAQTRGEDAISGRTAVGTHKSDFVVVHPEKNMPAPSCSTGEQKALLLSVILAEVRAKAAWKGSVPVVLLDEVVAHLDESRRQFLFHEFISLGAQVWLTGTDTGLFFPLEGHAQFFSVDNGKILQKTPL